MADYRTQAQQQYDPSYNAKVTALKNQLAQNQQSLEQQKTGINANYDQQVGNANLNNKLNKNNVSNTMLGRGLGNSSIAVSGLAEQDAKNTRIVGQIEQGRLGDLNNIDQQKALLAQNMNNTLGQMAGDRESEILALMRQLQNQDKEWGFKQQGLDIQREQMAMEQAYKNAQLALQREQMSASQKQDNSGMNSLIDSYTAITADKNMTQNEKYKMLQSLYTQAQMYGQVNGVDTSMLQNQIYSYGKQNPYVDPRALQQTTTTSTSKKGNSWFKK